jgi:hypothetical protein
MGMQHSHVARICSKNMQVYISKACRMEMQLSIKMRHGHATSRCSREIQQGHQHRSTAWTRGMCMLHGHAVWRSGMDAAWTCSFGMHLGHESRAYSKDIQQGPAAWTCRTDMQRGLAARICSVDMQRGREPRTCNIDVQHGHAAMTCRKDMQHGHASWTCSKDMQQGYEAWT